MNIINKIIWLGIVLLCGSTIKRTIEEKVPNCYNNAPKYIKFMSHPIGYLKTLGEKEQ